MKATISIAKWALTLGRGPQNFLGAPWVISFLRRVPEASKRKWALRLLSLSPHYFIDEDNPAFADMSLDEYLEESFTIISASREKIFDRIIRPQVDRDYSVIDYGCGPGFLAKAASGYCREIIAIDISAGALECARILNNAENIRYIEAQDRELAAIDDGSIDAVYSFAVFQHLAEPVLESVLATCFQKLRPGGTAVFHVQLPDDSWRSEDEWENDASVKGRVRYRFGLHCFGRTEETYADLMTKAGFADIQFRRLDDLIDQSGAENERLEDIGSQRIIVARRSSATSVEHATT